jgi:hypothetical protein
MSFRSTVAPRIRPRRLVALAAVGVLAVVGSAGVAGAAPAATVNVRGGFVVNPNESLVIDYRFAPGNVDAPRGERVRWRDRTERFAREPHTITIVFRGQQPADAREAFACFSGPCGKALSKHEKRRGIRKVVERKGSRPGLDKPRDSRWLAPGESIRPLISAPVGETLYYLCAIHPWMQGSVTVTG